jgi:acid phosphatase type 7
LQWLESDLSSSPLPWKIALFHKPPYSSGVEHGSDLAVRQAFGPLLEKYGVHMAITGHEHSYERSVPWRESPDRTKQAVTYIVTGGAGARLYPVRTSPWTARSVSKYHYIRVNVSGCVLYHEAVGADGVMFDRFTLDRCRQASDGGSPTVRIMSPGGGATVSGTVSVSVSATDDTRVEKVDLFVDGALVGLDRSYPYAISWNSRTVPAGSHALEARAYDLAGNRVSSAKVTVTTTGL